MKVFFLELLKGLIDWLLVQEASEHRETHSLEKNLTTVSTLILGIIIQNSCSKLLVTFLFATWHHFQMTL